MRVLLTIAFLMGSVSFAKVNHNSPNMSKDKKKNCELYKGATTNPDKVDTSRKGGVKASDAIGG